MIQRRPVIAGLLRSKRAAAGFFGLAALLIAAGLFSHAPQVSAAASAAPLQQAAAPTTSPNLSIGDEYCLTCHGAPGLTMPLGDGSTLDLFVDPLEYHASIHGKEGYACVQCHTTVSYYPHPAFSAVDRRDVTLQLNGVCQRCHTNEYERTQDSAHAEAMSSGKREAAVCSDCHTAHATKQWVVPQSYQTLPEARTAIPQTCALCHNAIYQKYSQSVHGAALTEENNPDVPTCIDCHGVHNIQNPTTSAFRLRSPQICSRCHTDEQRMKKYGISTQVLNTYIADFHGTTVVLFEKQSPDAETNKPVCYDCHGVHDIKPAGDPEKGLQVKENLLAVCQKCHPDASADFPTAWLSHYIPSTEQYPLVYYVNLFYQILIPVVLGGFVVLVGLDLNRKVINLWRKRARAGVVTATVETAPPEGAVEREQLPVTSGQLPVTGDQLPLTSDQSPVTSEEVMVNGEQLLVNSERLAGDSEQLAVDSEPIDELLPGDVEKPEDGSESNAAEAGDE